MCLQSSDHFSTQRESSVNAGYYNSSTVCPLLLPPGPVSATLASFYLCTPPLIKYFESASLMPALC